MNQNHIAHLQRQRRDEKGTPIIKQKEAPLFKRKSALISMGLLCLCFVALGCSAKVPRYVIDIDRFADTSPETSDKRLKEMVPVRLIGEEK